MAKKNDKKCECHPRCMGCKKIVIGALVLANAYYNVVPWAYFIGGLLVLGGLIKLVMPHCMCKRK